MADHYIQYGLYKSIIMNPPGKINFRDVRPVKPKVSEVLSSLGIYAHSVKPRKGWLKESKCSIRHGIVSDYDDMNTMSRDHAPSSRPYQHL